MTTEKRTRFSGIASKRGPVPVTEPDSALEPSARIGRPPGKKSDPNYTQVTVYLEKEVHNTARKFLIDEHRQFSDLVNELVSGWNAQKSGSLNG